LILRKKTITFFLNTCIFGLSGQVSKAMKWMENALCKPLQVQKGPSIKFSVCENETLDSGILICIISSVVISLMVFFIVTHYLHEISFLILL